jgi:8-oxo-dGTP pyrophosphatase MutT (NUDIX family)
MIPGWTPSDLVAMSPMTPRYVGAAESPTYPETVVVRIEREAARVLLICGERVLMFEGCDPADRGRGTWWFTPGGGVDPDESHIEAARRELHEESGIVIDEMRGPVWERTIEFPFDGQHYRQHELFFLAYIESLPAVVDTHWSELERRAVLGHRWWSFDELHSTDAVIHPQALRHHLRELVAGENGAAVTPRMVQ